MVGKKEMLVYGLVLVASFFFFLNRQRPPAPEVKIPTILAPSVAIKTPEQPVGHPKPALPVKEKRPLLLQVSGTTSPSPTQVFVTSPSVEVVPESSMKTFPAHVPAPASLSPGQSSPSHPLTAPVLLTQDPVSETQGDDTTKKESNADKPFTFVVSLPKHAVQRRISAIEISLRWNASWVRPIDVNEVCYDTSGSALSMQGPVAAASVKRVFAYPLGIDLPLALMTCRFQTIADVDAHSDMGISLFALSLGDFNGQTIVYDASQAHGVVSF